MTVEETVKLFNVIKLTYPKFCDRFTAEQKKAKVSHWQMTFADISLAVMQMAFEIHRRRVPFEPSDAEMFKALSELNGIAYEDFVRAKFDGDRDVAEKALLLMDQTERFKDMTREVRISYESFTPEMIGSGVMRKKLEG